ncbi:MAB_1171c family putative transporter [Nocardia xishanensis]|uniref:MAB_1171c family putative transporter n=1 Tax=Nocardia xishanensis TaxID=238964 RepID=UPI00082C11DA|nr:MAB_1171c family putative transporter [Nocardia xishanensis]
MNSPVPGVVAAPLIGFVAMVTFGRWALLHQTVTDRLFNRALAWACIGMLLLERGIAPRHGSLMHQLSMGCMLFAIMSAYGAAMLWSGADPNGARRRQRRYDLIAAACGAVILIVGTPAREQGTLLGETPDVWSAVSALAFCLPAIACGRRMAQVLYRELVSEDATRRERLVYGALLTALAVGASSLPFSALLFGGWVHVEDPDLIRWAWPTFTVIVLTATLLAVPLFDLLATRAGWDRSRRLCHRLVPLWTDVTGAVPEIVLDPASNGRDEPEVKLIRMTVEIRDALLHLNRYAPQDLPIPAGAGPVQSYAMRIAYAINAKAEGCGPVHAAPRTGAPESRDLDTELRQLLALARAWPAARAAVDAETNRPTPSRASAGLFRRLAMRA